MLHIVYTQHPLYWTSDLTSVTIIFLRVNATIGQVFLKYMYLKTNKFDIFFLINIYNFSTVK